MRPVLLCAFLACGSILLALDDFAGLNSTSEEQDENGDGSIDVKRTIWTRGRQRALIVEDRVYSDGRIVSWKDTVVHRSKPVFIQGGAPRNEGFLLRTYVQASTAGIVEIEEKGQPDLIQVVSRTGEIVDAFTRNRQRRLVPLSDKDLAELRRRHAETQDLIKSIE